MNKIKQAFITSYDRAIAPNTLPRIFDIVEPLESYYEKDCCNFTIDEIKSVLMAFRSSDVWTVRQKVSLLKSYTNYCIDHGFSTDGINHYVEVSTEIIESCIDKRKAEVMMVTEEDVDEMLALLDSPRDKLLILAPYEGISGKGYCEILELRKSDLLPNNLVKLCDGRIIQVSAKLHSIMEDAGDLSYYTRSDGKNLELQQSEFIFKSSKGNVASELSVKNRIMSIKKMVDRPYLGIKMLRNAGFYAKFDNLYTKYDNDYEKTFNSQEYADLVYQYNITFGKVKIRSDHRQMRMVRG